MTELNPQLKAQEAIESLAPFDISAALRQLESANELVQGPITRHLSALEQADPDTVYELEGNLSGASIRLPGAIDAIREFLTSLEEYAKRSAQ